MENVIVQAVVPNLIFFAVVFLIFSILEALIVLFMLWLKRKSHDWIMVFMLKCYRYYRKIRLAFQIAGMLLVLAGLWIIWSFLRTVTFKPEITTFAVIMLLVITLVYFVLIRLKGWVSLKGPSDRGLYIAISIILYIFILVLVNQKFPYTRVYVVDKVLNPAVEAIQNQLDANKKAGLLNTFREMAKNHQCPYKDYRDEKNPDIIHNFLYMATDPELQVKVGESVSLSPADIIKGNNCTNGKETFLLTAYGSWYWVIDTAKNQ